MFNDDVLGGALDAVYSYGPTKFVANLAFKTVLDNDLGTKFAHIDTTTHPLHGREYKKQEKSKIKVNFGHSKSRPDLPQLVQLLVSTENGIPFWTSTHSGNSSDSTLFPSSISAIQEFVKSLGSEVSIGFVADASLYKKKFLLSQGNSCDWISRVPESIKLAKGLVEKDHGSTNWTKIDKDFKYDVHVITYGKVQQRWFIVNNREARHKELETFNTNLKKEEELLAAKVSAIHNKIWLYLRILLQNSFSL